MKTIERLRELMGKATPGPLGIDYDNRDGGVDQIIECQSGRTLTVAFGTSDGNEYDLPSLVESRNALPALLAVVEAQAAEIRAWRANTAAIKVSADRWHIWYQACDFNEIHPASAATDAALRAMEGGSHE